jgi:hypothetical protein
MIPFTATAHGYSRFLFLAKKLWLTKVLPRRIYIDERAAWLRDGRREILLAIANTTLSRFAHT